jgi:hypothetical protein
MVLASGRAVGANNFWSIVVGFLMVFPDDALGMERRRSSEG